MYAECVAPKYLDTQQNQIELYLYVYFSALDGFRHNDIPQWSLFCSFDDGSFLLVFFALFSTSITLYIEYYCYYNFYTHRSFRNENGY